MTVSPVATQIQVSTITGDLPPEVRIRRHITWQLRTRPSWRELRDGGRAEYARILSVMNRAIKTWNSRLQSFQPADTFLLPAASAKGTARHETAVRERHPFVSRIEPARREEWKDAQVRGYVTKPF